jgi:hypothetical protein
VWWLPPLGQAGCLACGPYAHNTNVQNYSYRRYPWPKGSSVGIIFCGFCILFLIQEWSAGESLEDALRQLYLIDAIDENGHITDVGRIMAGISNLSASIEIQSLLELFICRLVFFNIF